MQLYGVLYEDVFSVLPKEKQSELTGKKDYFAKKAGITLQNDFYAKKTLYVADEKD